jgi:hypothetical protein
VDARLLRHVLAHHVDHVVHGFHGIERRASAVGRRCGVRRNAVKTELRGDVGGRAGRTRLVAIARMPRHRDVNVAEEAGAHHVHLARSALFGRRPVVAKRSLLSGRGHPFLDGDRGCERAGAKQVVTATVPGGVLFDRMARRRLCFLRKSGKRIELADDADDRLPGTERRHERRRDIGDT